VSGVEALSNEARRLITDAEAAGLVLRAIGSVAVRLHCEPSLNDMDMRQRVPKDIDLITRKRDRSKLVVFLADRGYTTDRDMLVAMEGTRYLYRNEETDTEIDVWVDVLDLCHRLDVRDRLGDGPTLLIEDLLLSKLQIVELTEGDINDIACILSSHELGVGSDDPEVIDAAYVAGLLAADWGFWKTATDNIRTLTERVDPPVRAKLEALLGHVDQTPKSVGWKLRSRIGERVQWWQDVDIPRDTY
jgi:hypothetical protein